jgi:hypothetical protein
MILLELLYLSGLDDTGPVKIACSNQRLL